MDSLHANEGPREEYRQHTLISSTLRGLTLGYPNSACSVSRTAAGPEVATCRLSWKERSPARNGMQDFHHNLQLQSFVSSPAPGRARSTECSTYVERLGAEPEIR
eukprot:6199157-Pleurochrysis_carterae.AAC.2